MRMKTTRVKRSADAIVVLLMALMKILLIVMLMRILMLWCLVSPAGVSRERGGGH